MILVDAFGLYVNGSRGVLVMQNCFFSVSIPIRFFAKVLEPKLSCFVCM